jgi:hypothetical protein
MKYGEMLDKFWEEMEISIDRYKKKQKSENRGGLRKKVSSPVINIYVSI